MERCSTDCSIDPKGYSPNVPLDAICLGDASAILHHEDQTIVVILGLCLRDTAIPNRVSSSAVLDNLRVVSDSATNFASATNLASSVATADQLVSEPTSDPEDQRERRSHSP